MLRYSLILSLALFVFTACSHKVRTEKAKQVNYKFVNLNTEKLAIQHSVYVPVYSNILHNNLTIPYELTATLSIRNTNFIDSIYVASVTYYNTLGNVVKEYINQPIMLEGMESIDFVVESQNKTGGLGANFVVHWASNKAKNKPLIQAVMISTEGQQGISFVCDGLEIE